MSRGAGAGVGAGFTVLELLAAMAIFLIICAAMFGLLQLSQQKYNSETQLSGSFQEARLAIDQISRDMNESGYPALSMYSGVPVDSSTYAYAPVAWIPGYTSGLPCTIGTGGGGTCTTPGDFDLIVETKVGTGVTAAVSWIRYQLIGTTLYRGVVAKPSSGGADPSVTSGAGVMVPFVVNVMNNPGGAQLSQITANYPSMFPGGVAQPIFQYSCDTATGPIACPLAGVSNSPLNIRDVDITLIVGSAQASDGAGVRLVELTGRGHRFNPSN
jgi:prepilin-type N-terminal cleavage/methylation domain-containing protein